MKIQISEYPIFNTEYPTDEVKEEKDEVRFILASRMIKAQVDIY